MCVCVGYPAGVGSLLLPCGPRSIFTSLFSAVGAFTPLLLAVVDLHVHIHMCAHEYVKVPLSLEAGRGECFCHFQPVL